MDYKKLIIEMLDNASERHLRLVYVYIKALLGLNKWFCHPSGNGVAAPEPDGGNNSDDSTGNSITD